MPPASDSSGPPRIITSADRQWFILQRWQLFDGESRANIIRIVAIGVFYAVHLYTYTILKVGTHQFHMSATALAVAWALSTLAVLVALRARFFPTWIAYLSVSLDLCFLGCVLTIAQGGNSALVSGYFVIIALSTLRFQLPLVWLSTVGSMISYLVVLAARHPDWFGSAKDIPVPRQNQLMILVALALTGITLGQVVRRVRSLAVEYSQRLELYNLRSAPVANEGSVS
ncbi:MAG: hypothetical protein KDA99_24065 [Planctomycetales bacterium]|nr:hypothetical protein [Planctomycetales bacterium]